MRPAEEYRARLDVRRATHARLTTVDTRFAFARLGAFAAGVLFATAAWAGWLTVWAIAVPVVVFIVLVREHDRVLRSLDAAAKAIAFYERGLARIEDRWTAGGETGERFRDPEHLYATDLDLFGDASLFQLLSLARTRAGEDTLATWLRAPTDVDEVIARQRAVADLTARLDLREALSLAGSDVRASVQTDALVAWAEAPPAVGGAWLRPIAVILTIAAAITLTIWIVTGNSRPFVDVAMIEIAISLPLQKRLAAVLHAAAAPAHDLDVLSVVLARLEQEQFDAERVESLQRSLGTSGPPLPGGGFGAAGTLASRAIRRMHRFVELHDWQHNIIFGIAASPFFWGTHLALSIERWRRLHGRRVREWLRICGEFEALASLSAYRYEHPADPFPEFAPSAGREAVLDGVQLGHPLIPSDRIVRNDVALNGAASPMLRSGEGHSRPPALFIVSGSNMSGKSTLLRTVGINTVLAFAGAPVRASKLVISPLRLGATLRIQDSLQEGRSRFYAEISRVRAIADLAAGPTPTLFLLDELFHGTNSHDRVVGASGVLRALLDRGAIGLITTHDLALTAVGDELAPRAANVHFDDRFEGGTITFDYIVKPGPVARSNALALMRAVGLDVPLDFARGEPLGSARGEKE